MEQKIDNLKGLERQKDSGNETPHIVSNHTPKPWNAETKSVHVISKYGLCECDVDSKDLLICSARGTNKEEAIDNARLIAASPDLYQACWEVVKATRGGVWSEAIAACEAAIRKVNGK